MKTHFLWPLHSGWYGANWWTHIDSSDQVGCALHEMARAVDGYLANDALSLSISPEPGITGIVS